MEQKRRGMTLLRLKVVTAKSAVAENHRIPLGFGYLSSFLALFAFPLFASDRVGPTSFLPKAGINWHCIPGTLLQPSQYDIFIRLSICIPGTLTFAVLSSNLPTTVSGQTNPRRKEGRWTDRAYSPISSVLERWGS